MTNEDLKSWREAHGLTQEQMAVLLGMEYGTYRGQETGRYRLNVLMPLALCEVERRLKAAASTCSDDSELQ